MLLRMLGPLSIVLVALAHLAGGCVTRPVEDPDHHQLVIRLPKRDAELARKIAEDHGMKIRNSEGPAPIDREAFHQEIEKGRGGKGDVFVQESCGADGYTTSIYTLSISSATIDNRRPWYQEECPSSIATYGGNQGINQVAIVTGEYGILSFDEHSGAAMVIDYALQTNPDLTWRDVQHIILRTANPTRFLDKPGWSTNGVGRKFSNKFGYGHLDYEAIIELSKRWRTVPEQHICTYDYKLADPNPHPLTGKNQLNFTLEADGCEKGTRVLYLEHVEVHSSKRFGKRGDLKLTLISPSGTTSVLLPPRRQDFKSDGFYNYLTVQMWGEDPRGTWTLMIESVAAEPDLTGTFHDWTLRLYGTGDPAQPGDALHAYWIRPRRV